jgi:glycosyltransferase 2 family protein
VVTAAWNLSDWGPEIGVRPPFRHVTVLRLVAIRQSRVQFEASLPSDRTRSAERADTTAPRGRRVLVQLLKITVSAALLWWLLSAVDLTRLWRSLRQASWLWLLGALVVYLAMLVVSSWRWAVLLRAQDVGIRKRRLLSSFLVATFFNNFLPSNIGGDVIRIRDTAAPANSRTLAATIVLIDRGLGLVALVLTAALGATLARSWLREPVGPVEPWMLWIAFTASAAGSAIAVAAPTLLTRLATPLRAVHAEWVDARLKRISHTLTRFRARPRALVMSALGALAVQLLLVGFYGAIASGLHIPIALSHLAVLVPVSFVVQMIPISMNGFGVREATFVSYFALLGLPAESALLLSFVGAALVMVWSLAGALVHVSRRA